ncbi:uncharacterized protein LOC144869532 isoform X2 [Branchiostoma floridae x Branchiostoma japonicum]
MGNSAVRYDTEHFTALNINFHPLLKQNGAELPHDLGEAARKFQDYDFPFENLVLEGGGAKGIAYVGAMKESVPGDTMDGDREGEERTPLHEASVNGQHETVQALLVAGADVNSRDIAHITPLHDAATKGHHETVRALLVAFADVNAKDLEQSTPLHMAAGNDNIEAVKAFLKAGGDVNARDTEQRTPLHLAARNGCHETVRALLMSHGVDVNAVTNQQWTPLHLAAMNGHHKTASVLLTANADVNARDEEQKTPLHLAAWNGDSRTVSVLLVAGADVNVQDKWCNIPIREAEKRGHSGCVEAIQKADEDSTNKGPKQKRGFDPVLVHFYEERGMTSASGKDPLIQEAAKQSGKSVDQVKNFIGSYRRSKGLQRKRKPPTEDSSNAVAKKSSLTAEKTNMLESESASHSAASVSWQGLNIAPVAEGHEKEGESTDNRDTVKVKQEFMEGASPNPASSSLSLHTTTLAGKHGPAVGVMAAGASVTAQTDQGAPGAVVQHIHHHLYYPESTTQQAHVRRHTETIASQGAGEAVKGNKDQDAGGQDKPKSVEVLPLHEPEKGTEKTKFIGNYRRSKGESKQRPPTDDSSDTVKTESTPTGKNTSADLSSPAAPSSSRPMLNTGSITDQKERERKEEALRGAAEKGQTTRVIQLLAEGINPNATGGRLQSTSLHLSSENDHHETVSALLKAGADITIRDKWLRTALHLAAWNGHIKTLSALLVANADVNARNDKLRTPLHVASLNGHTETVTALHTAGADVNIWDDEQSFPLHLAAQNGHHETVSALLKAGADVNVFNDGQKTPLHLATENMCHEAVSALLTAGADVNTWDDEQITPLHMAARAGDHETVSALLKSGSDVTARDKQGNTPLGDAEQRGHHECVKILQQHGVDRNEEAPRRKGGIDPVLIQFYEERGMTSASIKDPLVQEAAKKTGKTITQVVNFVSNYRRKKGVTKQRLPADGSGKTATAGPALSAAGQVPNVGSAVDENERQRKEKELCDAAENGDTVKVNQLLEQGVSIHATSGCLKRTPLHLSAENGHYNTVIALLAARATVNTQDVVQRTALHMAAVNGHHNIAKALLEAGATVNARADQQWTPVHLAAMNGHPETVSILYLAGADVNSRDEEERIPLHMAAQNGYQETVSVLLKAGSNVNIKNNEEKTSMHLAAMNGHHETVTLLTAAPGADVNSQDNKQMTPLHWAARNDDYETASALLAVDADVNAKDKQKSVPLHEAAIHGHPKCVEVLLQHGADVCVRNETGLSAKDIAKNVDSSSIGTDRNAEEVIRGRKEILKLLKEETNRMSQRKKESQAVLVRFYEEKGMTEVKKDCPLIQAAANESGRTVEQVKSFINYRKRKGKRPLQPDDNPGDTAGADGAKKSKTEDARVEGADGRGKAGGSSQRTEMSMEVSSTGISRQ